MTSFTNKSVIEKLLFCWISGNANLNVNLDTIAVLRLAPMVMLLSKMNLHNYMKSLLNNSHNVRIKIYLYSICIIIHIVSLSEVSFSLLFKVQSHIHIFKNIFSKRKLGCMAGLEFMFSDMW
jgi:hypothetical protein